MNINKLTWWVFALTGKMMSSSANAISKAVTGQVHRVVWASNMKYPELARNMTPGGTFFDTEFDEKTGKATSVRYRDPSGNEYYHNMARQQWIKL